MVEEYWIATFYLEDPATDLSWFIPKRKDLWPTFTRPKVHFLRRDPGVAGERWIISQPWYRRGASWIYGGSSYPYFHPRDFLPKRMLTWG